MIRDLKTRILPVDILSILVYEKAGHSEMALE